MIIKKRFLIFVLVLLASISSAGNWPQYRADAYRSGYTPETLPSNLSLQWVREACHQPNPAWVGRRLAQSRMKFDWVYSVAVADGQCYFGSSADNKVYALDAKTGEERWSYITGGPVRFAPAVWKDRVFAVSDDGFLYCFAAKDGRVLWKVNGGPEIDYVLGNGRPVSRWVARGGPAVRDGIVYFGAGIWPNDGVNIFAADAQNGKILWKNDEAGALEIDQPHMGAFSRSGVIAQGYLAITADRVLVMSGRSVPGAFDRETGRFLYYHLSRYGGKTPWGVGGGDVAATDDVFFTAGIAFDTATGLLFKDVGSRKNWWIPYVRDGHKYHGNFLVGERQVICPVPGGFIHSEGSKLYRSKLTHRTYTHGRELETHIHTPRLKAVGPKSKGYIEEIPDAPTLKSEWEMALPEEPRELIVAGDTAVMAYSKKIAMVDLKAQKLVWEQPVPADVYTMAVADGCLYASAINGDIYCFGAKGGKTKTKVPTIGNPYGDIPDIARQADGILEKAKITAGYCLHLGCGDGALAYALAKKSSLYVVAVESDPVKAAEARRKLDAAGIYGIRVTVITADLNNTHLPTYFANLIVAPAATEETARLQRPCGGIVYVNGKIDVRGALEGGGEWTHPMGSPGNTMSSDDQIAKGPLGTLWYRDEDLPTIDRHGKNPAPLYSEGIIVRNGIGAVDGIDAYNGRVIWRTPIEGLLEPYLGGSGVGATQIANTYCIADGAVYVRNEDQCHVLDLQTGKKLAIINPPKHPDRQPRDWAYIAVEDGILYGSLANPEQIVKSQHGSGSERTQIPMDRHFTESSLLFALDAKSGKVKWVYKPEQSIRNNSIAVADGRVMFIDRPVAELDSMLRPMVEELRRKNPEALPKHPPGRLIVMDGATGSVVWEKGDIEKTTLVASARHDVLLATFNVVGRTLPSESVKTGITAYKASTGEVLWESSRKLGSQRPVVVDDIMYAPPGGWDLLTGEPLMVERNGEQVEWGFNNRRSGCGPLAGSKYLLMGRAGAMGYYDLAYDPGELEYVGGARAGCWLNMLAVGGIVIAPDDTVACRCSYQNQATMALMEHGIRPPRVKAVDGQDNYQYDAELRAHRFTGSVAVEITHPATGYEIRYTLDDSYPTAQSTLYAKPFKLSETTTVRASVFKGERKISVRDGITFIKVNTLPYGRRKKQKEGQPEYVPLSIWKK